MATKPRGRGYALYAAAKGSQDTELRRPGEAGLKQRFGSASENNVKTPDDSGGSLVSNKKPEENVLEKQSSSDSQPILLAKMDSKPVEEEFVKLCDKITKMDLSLPYKELDEFSEDLKSICRTSDDFEKCCNTLFQFALKSKWNAHAIAILCNSHGDMTVGQAKLRNLLLKKLQGQYIERNKAYLELDKFLLNATFACEIFHHVRVFEECLKVLAHPIVEYFEMLLHGASQKEVEVFIEQFPKCYKNLKENDPNGLDVLLIKIRKEIVSETTTVTVKAMLLEMFELVLTDWMELSTSAKNFYETLSKPIVKICN